jgi:hypothetical protein
MILRRIAPTSPGIGPARPTARLQPATASNRRSMPARCCDRHPPASPAGPGESSEIDVHASRRGDWIRGHIRLKAAYDEERVPIELILPKIAEPPRQVMISSAPDGATQATPLDDLDGRGEFEMYVELLLKTGRALACRVPLMSLAVPPKDKAPGRDGRARRIVKERCSLIEPLSRPYCRRPRGRRRRNRRGPNRPAMHTPS